MIDYLIVGILLTFSALFSGLTLGLMSLSASELKRKMTLGNQQAAKIYAVRENGNLLLTTLLIGNVAINSALAIYLGSIASGVVAGLIATGLIVVFGEIAPQAVFSRFALQLGSKVVWLVKIFIFIFYPISAPIAWLLDRVLGEELNTVYSKRELMKIVEEHKLDSNSDVDKEEAQIITGALTFSHKKVLDIMTPRTVMYTLPSETVVDDDVCHRLAEEGFMRIPIYQGEADNIIGIVHLSQLLKNDVEGKAIGNFASKGATFVKATDHSIRRFYPSYAHGGTCTSSKTSWWRGLVTLEDILEEILQEEIMDENDTYEDMREHARTQV